MAQMDYFDFGMRTADENGILKITYILFHIKFFERYISKHDRRCMQLAKGDLLGLYFADFLDFACGGRKK
jgi:hypothetical protein